MISELFPSLAAAAFAALLFHFFLKRRSREINRGEANNDAAANNGTAGGASGAHTSTGVPEMATSSVPAKDAAANDGTAGGASGAHTSTESHEMANSLGDDFEVFLSFRGPDTRAGIADFLYTSLTDAGIRTFRDDEDLRKGEEFAPKLLQAIKKSKILVPIFSKDYATSVWCLKEVVQMVECKKTGGQKIMPIFYDVAPAEVRHQTGGYREAFLLHDSKKRYDQKTIGEWKAALSAIGEINGWDLHNEGENRREGELVKTFTREVFNELKKASLAVSDYLVSVDNHVDAIMEKIGKGTNETRIIGIHGMGGIGKTTIAKIIFNKFSHDFENCCFLRDIRETSKNSGIQGLQKQLISSILKMECMDIKDSHEGTQTIKDRLSNKRVLLLLDDVEEANHIDALVCKRDWLGKGSKIIITSRRIDVLKVPEVDDRYELTSMDRDQSLQLFSKHAFRRDSPLDEYINQSNKVIDIAGGLPLALEVIGSLLYCTEKKMWDATLKMLENVPHAEVQSKLRISYDGLELRQRHMFLDIACLFIGYDKDILVHFWDESDFFPEVDMKLLQNLSLIKINEDNKVWMHDQLRDLGRKIVRQESDMKIEKQSRVWDSKIGSDLLRKHKGKKEVQALHLDLYHLQKYRFTYEDFESLSDLRFLEVDAWMEYFRAEERLLWHKSPSNVLPTNENSDLLPHLRWLSWSRFPSALDIANFFMEDVVILNLSKSNITNDWKGWSHMKVMKNLKVLNLSNCYILRRLPDELGRYLASLEHLYLNECRWLERLPDSIENMKSLIELDISGTGIKELPHSIGKLKNLKRLKMRDCFRSKIPNALWTIEKLEEIEVAKSNKFDSLDVNIGNCIYKNQSLRILRLHQANIFSLPRLPESLVILRLRWLRMDTFPDLSNLTNLKELDLEFRSRDSHEKSHGAPGGLIMSPLFQSLTQREFPSRDSDGLVENLIPRSMGNLSKLESLRLTSPCGPTSPTDFTLPPHLKSLYICSPNLCHLPRLFSSLSSLHLYECKSLCSMESLDLSSPHLKELRLEFCRDLRHLPRLPSSLSSLDLRYCDSLCSMESLELVSPYVTTSPTDLTVPPPHLKELHLHYCPKLRHLPRLPSSLSSLDLYGCESLCSMEDLSNLKNLSSLCIRDSAIEEFQGLGCLENLRDLVLFRVDQVKILPDLSNLNKLTNLHVSCCGDLVEIQGALPQFLDKLYIYSCDSLQNLPDLSSLMGKQKVQINECSKLNVEAILGFAQLNQRDLLLWGFGQLQILPDLSNSSELRCLQVHDCHNLIEIQGKLPESLEVLEITSCDSLQKLPDLSSLKELQKVDIKDCKELKGEAILGSACRSQENLWENLQYMRICGLEQMEILPDLSNLNKLRHLEVRSCANLIEIQGKLPESLEVLEITSCDSLQKLPDLSSLKELQRVDIKDCKELKGDAILGSARRSQANLWENLQYMRICGLEQMEMLPDLSNLNKLRHLEVRSCANLVEIEGELPKSLKVLDISSCRKMQKLLGLSSLNGLRTIKICDCFGLNVEAISSLCSEKSIKFVEDDVPVGWDAEFESEYEGEDEE